MDAGHRVDQRAEGTGWSEDIDQLLLDEMDKSRQANVVFAQHIGQRLEKIGADIAQDVGDRVVGQEVPQERQLDAEHLAAEPLLQCLE